ncbi:aminoacyl-tRNA hydrolase [Natranaerofaba carboxydovora]|uniref:aminoacyl-tRNA hydrolase n=1 Tax=Natranaerofaba carboxydovora TaxID=2742683 RepID=UPI001F13F284|nr:aminoacyl-tRNA hydrolase [Natranaerofaba carboxydovora]UMZ75272.1 Peptidyl-tRNA hydrolase [Natranaerofaba carboxydovora]
MNLIVGLGNPGVKYKETRHNVGFMVVEEVAKRNEEKIDQSKYKSIYGQVLIENEKAFLIKPMTYMNKSGESLIQWKNFYKIENKNILVIYDDMDMEEGKIKIKPQGGAGGHRGLASIINCLGSEQIPRLKIGIGKPKPPIQPSDYVLQKFNDEELEVIKQVIGQAARAAEEFCYKPLEDIMTKYNSY